jgi:2,3-bisphosphoglycerate-dependent phosphoglycerate mutase
MTSLVLLRHGQSDWNAKNLFTGWYDSDLSPKGEAEAREAGRLLRDEGVRLDVCTRRCRPEPSAPPTWPSR